MNKQHWTIKEAAETLGLSEKTVRRRIKDGTLKAEQTAGKYGVEYRITGLNDALPLDKSPVMDRGLDIEGGAALDRGLGMVGDTALTKALDIIKGLQEANERLAVQVGFLQAQVIELDSKVRLLTEPKQKRSWWQWLLRRRITPEA